MVAPGKEWWRSLLRQLGAVRYAEEDVPSLVLERRTNHGRSPAWLRAGERASKTHLCCMSQHVCWGEKIMSAVLFQQ